MSKHLRRPLKWVRCNSGCPNRTLVLSTWDLLKDGPAYCSPNCEKIDRDAFKFVQDGKDLGHPKSCKCGGEGIVCGARWGGEDCICNGRSWEEDVESRSAESRPESEAVNTVTEDILEDLVVIGFPPPDPTPFNSRTMQAAKVVGFAVLLAVAFLVGWVWVSP